MHERLNLIGAVIAVSIYFSSIFIFSARILGKPHYGHRIGYFLFLLAIPLLYLLVKALQLQRPAIYYIQIGLMLSWLFAELLLDYIFKIDFRRSGWMVICYVTLFFAATGGMLGVASLAGRGWTIISVVLFLAMAILAFIQRNLTGL
ncbi:hypothetical protein GF407_17920 [candidate division KSB1 bacterium]|nr:hypothetical protein [candidate division KSB1 bacterium]